LDCISNQPDLFDDHLRRASMLLYAAGTVLVLLIANVPKWNDGYNRAGANLVAAGGLLSIVLVWHFPWHRYERNLFLTMGASASGLVAGLVHFTGGITSPFNLYFFLIVFFSTLYYDRVFALLAGTIVTTVSLAPLLYSGAPLNTLHHHLLMAVAYMVTVWIGNLMATELARREGARERLEDDLTEVRRLSDDLGAAHRLERRRTAQLQAVHDIGRTIASVLDPARVHQVLVEAAHERLGYAFVTLFIPDGEQGDLLLAAPAGLGAGAHKAPPGPVRLQMGKGIVGHVAESRAPYYAGDVRIDPLYEPLGGIPIRSKLAVPILSGGELLGVLDVESETLDDFDEMDLMTMEAVADQAAVALQNAHAHTLLSYRALHDPLTGLSNRVLFLDRLDHALIRRPLDRAHIAVLFVDLDRFKLINDSLGHDVGDDLLVAVAARLQVCLRPEDTIARIGGDEFTVLLDEVVDVTDAVRIADRMAEALQRPFALGAHETVVTASIGIVLGTCARDRPADLLRDADIAMYRAKQGGKARYAVFDPQMSADVLRRLALEVDLRRALVCGEFRVYYQPTVDLDTDRIVGMEALVRWEHPERGLVSPAAFIPLAEETGLILPLGRWVLQGACHQARAWQMEHPTDPPLTISVNLSGRQFQHPELVDEIEHALRETELPACSLVLELTESILMEDAESNIASLRRLKSLGVQIAIDDFGTGYSSLGYLKRFPVDILKVDKSFVDRLGQDAKDTAIVRTVIGLARSLGLQVTAEGVETHEQLAILRSMGADLGQWYYLSPPLSAEATDILLSRGGVAREIVHVHGLELVTITKAVARRRRPGAGERRSG